MILSLIMRELQKRWNAALPTMLVTKLIGVRARRWILCVGLLAPMTAHAASDAVCPGHPDALGTSRTLVVDPREHPRIGTMQYAETLPLSDHEVVLTFDDGPVPRNSNQILQILASQCVKATFFIVGRQARSDPASVRKVAADGHTVGTHSQNHPLSFDKMPIERVKQEIDEGIASTTAALGDPDKLAPFFRVPGLRRAGAVEDYAASKGIQIWSADFPADDWRHIPSSRVYELAMKRLENKGKGILLLHDIQARTVAALPKILQELKARGYRIVHVVPATADEPATPTEPQQWQLHRRPEAVAESHWPAIPRFVFAATGTLPAPSPLDLSTSAGRLLLSTESFDHTRRPVRGVPLPRESPWPRSWPQLLAAQEQSAALALPVPAESIFQIQEKWHAVVPSARHAEQAAVRHMPVGAN